MLDEQRFCGAQRAGRRPYCAEHVALAYLPAAPMRTMADPSSGERREPLAA